MVGKCAESNFFPLYKRLKSGPWRASVKSFVMTSLIHPGRYCNYFVFILNKLLFLMLYGSYICGLLIC